MRYARQLVMSLNLYGNSRDCELQPYYTV